MRRLRYDESPRHQLHLEGGLIVPGGQTFEVADDLAERLLASEVPIIEQPEADGGEGHESNTEEDSHG